MGIRKKQVSQNQDKKAIVEDKDSDGGVNILTSDSKITKHTRSLRGITQMHCLAIQRCMGEKKDVQFNKYGQPIEKVASKMQSYIGVLAREKVKITYESWDIVPTDVKELIWESVNLSFNVDQRWKKGCISSAGDKWRQHKSTLTSKFVYARKDSPNLKKPPAKYPHIQSSEWSEFVISRLNENFKKTSEVQKERRRKYIHSYRFSRKGYAKYADENPTLLCDDPEINQATLWIEGRKRKDETYEGDELKEKVAKIDEYISKKKAGTLKAHDMKGIILEEALVKEEHRGRLRGIGGHVTQTVYYNVPRGKKDDSNLYHSQQQELMEEKRINAEQNARIAKLEAIVYKTSTHDIDDEGKGSCSVKYKLDDESPQMDHHLDESVKLGEDEVNMPDDDVVLLDRNAQLQGKLVALSLESSIGIAAFGTVLKACEPNEEFLGNNMCVAIDEADEENALLPFPTSECKSVGDAVGSHVTWPVHLLKMKHEISKKKKQEKKESTVDYSTVPRSLRVVHCFCKATLEGKGNIMIEIEESVFGNERTLHVHLEDVEPFCQLKPITYTCIAIYIWHLYKMMVKLNKVDRFKFVDPLNICHFPSLKNDKKTVGERIEQRARELAVGLVGASSNQIVLAPCNTGAHWILTAIDPYKEYIALLDPLYTGNYDGAWKQVVELALKLYNAQTQRKGKKTPIWTIIKVPKQSDGYQCGFYVMKYMKEIVNFDSFETISSLQLVVIDHLN